MKNNLLIVLAIGTGILLIIITIINNIKLKKIQKSSKLNTEKFNKTKKLVNIYNNCRFLYLGIIYITNKYSDNINYTITILLILFWIQILFSIAIYRSITSLK